MTREGHQDQFGLQRYGFVLEQVWKAFSPEKGQSADLPDHVAFKEILAGIFGGCTRSFDGKISRLLGVESLKKQVIAL